MATKTHLPPHYASIIILHMHSSDLELGVGKSAGSPFVTAPQAQGLYSAFASSNFFPGIIHDLACNHFKSS
jgi:hypothetical protein